MKPTTDTGLDLAKWLGGAAAGALLMYMLDPDRGRARRTMAAERIRDAGHQAGERIRDAGHQAGDRLGNVWQGIGHRIGSAADTVAERARDMAGSLRPDGSAGMEPSAGRMSHKASAVWNDTVERASDLARDAGNRVKESMPGVRGDWAPAMRSSAVLGGGMLGMYGMLRRSPLSLVLGLAGLALLARGATNQPLASMVRGRSLGQTIDLEQSIHIDASPEEVYDICANYENFPHIMSHVVEVRDLGRRRSHWVVKGPAGSEFEWNSVLTEQIRPKRLAWRTEPGAEIGQTGSISFEPHRGGTLLTVRMSYSPPAGALGHGIATLLGADPKRQMDDDLVRLKAFIERGALPAEAAQRARSSSRFLH